MTETSLIEEYWSWSAWMLYILGPLDVLTTLFIVATTPTGQEANPLMAWVLRQGPLLFAAVNLVAVVAAALGIHLFINRLQAVSGTEARVMRFSFEVWIGLLLAVGLYVFANNLSVLFFHESLLRATLYAQVP